MWRVERLIQLTQVTHIGIKMIKPINGGLEHIVLSELANIAKNSPKVTNTSVTQLANSLNLSALVIITTIKKLQKIDLLQVIFDDCDVYFKLTGLAYEVTQ